MAAKGSAAVGPKQRGLLRPQASVQQAAAGAKSSHSPRAAPPPGAAHRAQRLALVQRLQTQGLGCETVWAAMREVPRHPFVDSALAAQAYEDTALPIGYGQTISKPSVVARMLALALQAPKALATGRLGSVLEIGAGCGYQAALLSLLSQSLVSIERLGPLADKARLNLEHHCKTWVSQPAHGAHASHDHGQVLALGQCPPQHRSVAISRPCPVLVLHADGRHGHAPKAPYDAIVSAAGGDDVPPTWLDQLAIGGRLVAPVRLAAGAEQALLVVDRQPQGYHRQVLEAVHFVPLKSGAD